MAEDVTLTCRDCGRQFVFSARESEFFAAVGLKNRPARCRECRAARRAARERGTERRETFLSTCARCGGEARLPFRPTNGKPVYCSACFAAIRAEESAQGSPSSAPDPAPPAPTEE